MGSGFLVDSEIAPLAKHLGIAPDKLKKKYLEEVEILAKKRLRPKLVRKGKPYGRCIFYDTKKVCTVHDAKPLQCKVAMGCKAYSEDLMVWFMLNHLLDLDDAESIRQYSVYLKSGGKTLQGGKLEEMVPKKVLSKVMAFDILR